VNALKKHGLTAELIRNSPLWFYQTLFPLAPPEMSGVKDDNRMPYFSDVAAFTNTYAAMNGRGIGIGHDWNNVSVQELVRWTAVPIRHGSMDGNPGTVHTRWKENDPRYDPVIADNIGYERWKQIKSNFKLNNNLLAKKRGEEGYDPCNKYDMIFRTLVHNMNYCTERADKDQAVDESTWGFAGFCAETGGRLMNKPVSKGMLSKMIIIFSFTNFEIISLKPKYYFTCS